MDDSLPADATVIEAPTTDPDGAFAALVGRFAASLDEGSDPGDAFSGSLAATDGTEASPTAIDACSGQPRDQLGPVAPDVVDEAVHRVDVELGLARWTRRPTSSPGSWRVEGPANGPTRHPVEDDRHPVVEVGDRFVRRGRHDRERPPDGVVGWVAPAGPQPCQRERPARRAGPPGTAAGRCPRASIRRTSRPARGSGAARTRRGTPGWP